MSGEGAREAGQLFHAEAVLGLQGRVTVFSRRGGEGAEGNIVM